MAIVWLIAPAAAMTYKAGPVTLVPQRGGMRVIVVRLAGNCGDACPEWIAAEGKIGPETTAEFRKALALIGRRNVPVFIHSPGGTIGAAMDIGRLLRARHMTISVTRTILERCGEGGDCGGDGDRMYRRGRPQSAGAICASACAYLIAGASQRYVGPDSLVGIHDLTFNLPAMMVQVTMTTIDARGREIELGHKRMVVTPKASQLSEKVQERMQATLDVGRAKIEAYLREMGIAPETAERAFATKPPEIHWMTRSELAETRLMTRAEPGESLIGVAAVAAASPAFIDPVMQHAEHHR